MRAGWPLEQVYVGEDVELDTVGVDAVRVASGVLERVSTTVTPRPVVAVGRQRTVQLVSLPVLTFVVVLVDVADPGNLGTIVRTAEAAGADAVVVCGGVDVFGPKCVRASAGSLFFMPIVRSAAARPVLDELGAAGVRRLATSSRAVTAYDAVDLRGPVAVVLGSEAHGLADEVLTAVDETISIPIAGQSESLNVAGAAAVLCFEVARQRRDT